MPIASGKSVQHSDKSENQKLPPKQCGTQSHNFKLHTTKTGARARAHTVSIPTHSIWMGKSENNYSHWFIVRRFIVVIALRSKTKATMRHRHTAHMTKHANKLRGKSVVFAFTIFILWIFNYSVLGADIFCGAMEIINFSSSQHASWMDISPSPMREAKPKYKTTIELESNWHRSFGEHTPCVRVCVCVHDKPITSRCAPAIFLAQPQFSAQTFSCKSYQGNLFSGGVQTMWPIAIGQFRVCRSHGTGWSRMGFFGKLLIPSYFPACVCAGIRIHIVFHKA